LLRNARHNPPFHRLVVADVTLVRIGNLRLASQNQPNPPSLNKMIDIGIRFEKEIFEKSPNKVRGKIILRWDTLLTSAGTI
jgi:hypothetical protein